MFSVPTTVGDTISPLGVNTPSRKNRSKSLLVCGGAGGRGGGGGDGGKFIDGRTDGGEFIDRMPVGDGHTGLAKSPLVTNGGKFIDRMPLIFSRKMMQPRKPLSAKNVPSIRLPTNNNQNVHNYK